MSHGYVVRVPRRRGCALTAVALAPLAVALALFAREPKSGPLGGRHADPKHKDGSWTYERPAEDEDPNPPSPPEDTDGYRIGRRGR